MKFINFKSAVKNDICSGCGGCAYLAPQKIRMEVNKAGEIKPLIYKDVSREEENILDKICPFSYKSLDKDNFQQGLAGKDSDIVGVYQSIYAGHVNYGNYRENGSSGGFGTWLSEQLLQKGLVENIVHVKRSEKNSLLYKYSVSKSVAELKSGSSSKYYPITMDEVLRLIKESKEKFLLIAVPCFVRTVRNLQKVDTELEKNIPFIGGLYCGHLKTHYYSQYIADNIKYTKTELEDIDFRVKEGTTKSSNYKTSAVIDGERLSKLNREIIGTNWGLGLFKYKSCDFCEDVSAELADFSIGDAWLPRFEKDSKGKNLIIVRNPAIHKLFKEKSRNEEIDIEELTLLDAYNTQAGGYRHKRDGIHIRNKLLKLFSGKEVKTRYSNNTQVSFPRKSLYLTRVLTRNFSRYYYLYRKNRILFFVFNLGVLIFSKIFALLNKLEKK